ncbi:PilZ domain-containing protein [Sphingomonas sp. CJ20]
MIARLEVLGEVDQRGAIRFTVSSDTTLRGADGQPIDVVVENLSRTGFLFLSDTEIPAGSLVAIGLSGAGAREAQVVWRDGNRHGCEFLVPLPQSAMAKAFKGRDDVIADLEEAIQRRFAQASGQPEAGEDEPDPDPDPAPPRARRFDKLRRAFGRR